LNYRVINDTYRDINAPYGTNCDGNLVPGWYRLYQGSLPAYLPESGGGNGKCGTDRAITLQNGALNHPAINDGVVKYTVRWDYGPSNSLGSISIRNCNGAYWVYYLTNLRSTSGGTYDLCSGAPYSGSPVYMGYCTTLTVPAIGITQLPPSPPPPSLPPSPPPLPSICSGSYTIINDTSRDIDAPGGCRCDSALSSGWYRFFQGAFNAYLPEWAVVSSGHAPNNICGTGRGGFIAYSLTFPAYAGGLGHPAVSEGIVRRTLVFEYGVVQGNNYGIDVVNCSSFFLYNFLTPSALCRTDGGPCPGGTTAFGLCTTTVQPPPNLNGIPI
jgi:hypothetical protein